ncbi:uncharacterized protein BDV17DRAFT_301062 [Aspergillus undulatus]|uniref:uncharacterized protein n=1 Tax=Aspergillus undulatus TaxID=1810928 RepID=UPI003CCDAF15
MPLFRRKEKSKPSISSSAFRSVEHLPHLPSSGSSAAAPPFDSGDNNNSNNNLNNSHHHRFPVSTSQQFPPQTQPQPGSHSHHSHTHSGHSHSHSQPEQQQQAQPPLYSWDARQPPPRNPNRYSLQRSHTQRLRTPPDVSTLSNANSNSNSNSTITVVNNSPPPSHLAPPHQTFDADSSDQSWPSSPIDKPDSKPEDHHLQEPRRSKRSLFSFHSSASSTSVRDQSSLLERNRSVKVSSRRQSQQQQQPQTPRQRSLAQHSPQQQQPRLSVDNWSRDYAVDASEADHQPSMPQQSINTARVPDPGLAPHSRSPHPSPIPRSNTDPHLFDQVYQQHRTPTAGTESSRHGADLAPPSHQLDPRPPSRQSIGTPSPFPQPQSESSSVSQLGAMSDRPLGGNQQNQSQASLQPGPNQDGSSRNNAGQQAGLDTGHATPTSKDNRSRDDLSELDFQTLAQKYQDLLTKYSKVKRYYFERDAQVQSLQNTVAHQRMAVSRTVLDDNEYANRFGRLDGAIKDLAFSIRKDWKSLPNWLAGYVNEDAPAVGTKEMTAIGRSLMSRWLVNEIFERYFHPALEPTFSQHLKSIEMTLRRQYTNTATEEDTENSIARISNWRRTTLDGLGNSLQGPTADEHRTNLINRLVDSLVATIVSNLHDPAPPGIDNGVRMIVENAVGIAEKIPLESRDICVEYPPPGAPIHEPTMKIEAGVLPPLTNAASPIDSRRSAEHPSDLRLNPDEDIGATADDRDRELQLPASANTGGPDSAPAREQRMRSVFSNIMGRKPGQIPPSVGQGQGPGPTPTSTVANNEPRCGSVGTPASAVGPGPGQQFSGQGQGVGAGVGNGAGRIRLAAFITAEVRGRGPMNVLVKAPAYPIE